MDKKAEVDQKTSMYAGVILCVMGVIPLIVMFIVRGTLRHQLHVAFGGFDWTIFLMISGIWFVAWGVVRIVQGVVAKNRMVAGGRVDADHSGAFSAGTKKCVSCGEEIGGYYSEKCRRCGTDNSRAGVEEFNKNKEVETAQQERHSKREALEKAIETCKANIRAAKDNPSDTPGLDEARIKANVEEIAKLEVEMSKLP